MNNSNITYFTDVALITCVVKAGVSDTIIQAARNVGATTGAISYHAHGYGARERLGLLGIAVETEKEVVNILVSSEQQDTIANSIYRAGKLNEPGNGYLYITALDKVATYIPHNLMSQLEKNS